MNQIEFNPNALSHHTKTMEYYITHGINIDDIRYRVAEFRLRAGLLYAVITSDDVHYYEVPLSTSNIEDSYDDTELRERIVKLETAPKYTYDDTAVIYRIEQLESKVPYDDTNIKTRLTLLENKEPTEGKSAYQVWLDLGNSGTEQDFINSLKGAKGDKGDVTDIGTNALVKSTVNITNSKTPLYLEQDHYKTLTYNTKSQLGILHLDLRPTEELGMSVTIGSMTSSQPKPYSLIETSVIGNNTDGVGQIYVTTSGAIMCNYLKANTRYTVDLIGYFE